MEQKTDIIMTPHSDGSVNVEVKAYYDNVLDTIKTASYDNDTIDEAVLKMAERLSITMNDTLRKGVSFVVSLKRTFNTLN